jgi:hypothetical protein
MSKYEPLANFLSKLTKEKWTASFAEIEKILGFPLPKSAYQYPAWWANQSGDGHSQKVGWYDAGWKTIAVDLETRRITFERVKHEQPARAQNISWSQAREFTGISDQKELERAAIKALMQQEAAKRLAALGGTMADIVAAPRERS